MATEKTFTVAGVSKLDGEFKVRFANDVMRVKVLAKNGHEDVNMIELEQPMSKLDAALFLQELDEFQDPEVQACIADYIDRNTEKPKAEKKAKAKKVEAAPAEEAAATDEADDDADYTDTTEATDDNLEDAPF